MEQNNSEYESGSLSLLGTVAMGTGVMIGAGIFALTGQVTELAVALFPLAFLVAAIISGFSAYSYIKMSNAYPSAGGIAMYLKKAYGPTTMTGACALLMAFSMIINESLVARTFGTYTLQLFNVGENSVWVPVLAVGLVAVAFLINVSGNKIIGSLSQVTAFLKIGGIIVFAAIALWAVGFSFEPSLDAGTNASLPGSGFLAGVAIAILAYKGFTTITNSGEKGPRNDGKLLEQTQAELPEDWSFVGDKAYVGKHNTTVPDKKPPGGQLTEAQKAFNKQLSQQRIYVEHVIRTVKIFRIAKELFRMSAGMYEQVIGCVCGLVRLRARYI